MKTLDADLILAKNRRYTDKPWINLLIVEIDDSTTTYWAIYPEDVTFGGQTYTSIPAAIETQTDTNQGRIEGLTVHVANATREVSAYVENAQLLGNTVTRRIVWADTLGDANAYQDWDYRIDSISVTDQVASFSLGRSNLMAVSLPQQRFIRNRCRFVYKDARCQYPSDEFTKSTRQDLKDTRTTGSPFQKLHGWWVLNPHLCYYAHIAMTASMQYLTNANVASTVAQWWDTAQSALYAFKLLSGDFDVYYLHASAAFTDNDRWAGCIIQSSVSTNDWIATPFERISGSNSLRVLSTVSGVTSQLATSSNWWPYVRVVRSGDSWTIYYKLSSSSAWTSLHTFSRSLSDPVRIGFSHGARSTSTPAGIVQWDYIRFTSGGLATCDMTFDGPNGCREHCNTSHYGGAPAIPRGRIM